MKGKAERRGAYNRVPLGYSAALDALRALCLKELKLSGLLFISDYWIRGNKIKKTGELSFLRTPHCWSSSCLLLHVCL